MTPDVLPELWAIWVCDSTGGFWLLAGDDGPEGIKCYKSEELAKEALQWEIEGGYIQTRHGEVGKIIRIK
jgi:hypothetical protein